MICRSRKSSPYHFREKPSQNATDRALLKEKTARTAMGA